MDVLVYLFGRSLFLQLLLVSDGLCGRVPCLRYPREGKSPQVYYYIIVSHKHCAKQNTVKPPQSPG